MVEPRGDLVPALAEAGPPLFAFVGNPVTFDGSASDGLAFAWSFGDGASGPLNPDPRAAHTYDRPGHYTAQLQVTGEDGGIATDTTAVTVTWPTAANPPNTSSALVAVGDGLVAVMPDHDALVRVDRASHQIAMLDTCGHPRSLSVGTDRVAVACTDDEVRLYDLDLDLVATVPMPRGSRPFGVVITHEDRVVVTLQGADALATVDDAGLVSIDPIGPDPRGLASTVEGLLVTRHRSEDAAGTMWQRQTDGDATWPLAPDPGPDSDTDARGVPTYLQRVVVRPDGRVAVTGGLKANVGRGLVRDGLPLTHETTTRAVLRQVALNASEGAVGSEVLEPAFDDRDLVSAMAFHPRGDWLFVAHLGVGMVDVVDSYTMARVGGFHDVGDGPDGLWVSEDGAELWVLASLSRELVVLDVTDPFGPQVELARIDLSAGRPEPLGAQGLLGKQTFYRSSDPRMTQSGYMHCGSCHLDGDHDGRTWDFTDRGEGVRNTIPLLGHGGLAQGPLHWTANFDELQDFEGDIRGPMAGAGFLSQADWEATQDPLGEAKAGRSPELDAMAAWLSTLDQAPASPWRDPDGSLSTLAEQGEALFLAPLAGCADCHPPPEYTDSGFQGPGLPLLHDVGTLTAASGERLGQPLVGLDTPTLRGLHASAPYLHDGSIASVRELLVANQADDRHGVTSHLSGYQLDALNAFLLSLE